MQIAFHARDTDSCESTYGSDRIDGEQWEAGSPPPRESRQVPPGGPPGEREAETRLLPEYMRLLCQRPAFHADMRLRSTGTAERRNRLKPGDLLSIEIELPPIDEQREIASVVAAVEEAGRAALDERERAFALLDAAVDALIAPSGDWLHLPQGWQLKQLGDVAEVRSGITKGRKTRV